MAGLVCFPSDYWKKMAKVLRSAGHHLIPVKENLVDKIWTDRPERPCKPLLTLGLDYTGQNCSCAQQGLPPSSPPPVPRSPSRSSESKSRLSDGRFLSRLGAVGHLTKAEALFISTVAIYSPLTLSEFILAKLLGQTLGAAKMFAYFVLFLPLRCSLSLKLSFTGFQVPPALLYLLLPRFWGVGSGLCNGGGCGEGSVRVCRDESVGLWDSEGRRGEGLGGGAAGEGALLQT